MKNLIKIIAIITIYISTCNISNAQTTLKAATTSIAKSNYECKHYLFTYSTGATLDCIGTSSGNCTAILTLPNSNSFNMMTSFSNGVFNIMYNGSVCFTKTGVILPNQVNGYPGDCSQLGTRKPNESYSDCWSRNFSNYCCDMLSCLSITLYPELVLPAISLSCCFNGMSAPAVPIGEPNYNIGTITHITDICTNTIIK